MTKTKTITVTHCNRSEFDGEKRTYMSFVRYRVEQITDSIDFAPQQELPPEVVRELCESSDWKVIVKGPKQ
jgi:hypothetical protein